MASLNNFIGALKHGGARSNQFRATITPPSGSGVNIDSSIQYLLTSTTLPSLTISSIPLMYRGRQVFVTGERTYDPWEINFLHERDQNLLHAFQEWHNHLGDIGNVLSRSGVGDEPSSYYGSAVIQQLTRGSKDGLSSEDPIRTYYLYDVWPAVVAGYEVNFETEGLVTSAVTLQFNYMTIEKGGSLSGGGKNTTVTASVTIS